MKRVSSESIPEALLASSITDWSTLDAVHDDFVALPTGPETVVEFFGTVMDDGRTERGRDGVTSAHLSCFACKEPYEEEYLKKAAECLTEAIRAVLKDEHLTARQSMYFLRGAERRWRDTKNPLWAWVAFDIYVQAGFPPPPWVWQYLIDSAYEISSAASDAIPLPRSKDEKPRALRNEDVLAYLGLERSEKSKDHATHFRKELADFRLAVRVSNSGLQNSGGRRKGIMKTCRDIVVSLSKRRLTERDIRNKAAQVRKAFELWFPKPLNANASVFKPTP